MCSEEQMGDTLSYSLEHARVRRLPNGVTVLVEPLPYLRSVAAGVWIRAGSANERVEQSGVSHFLEHLFFKGTLTRTTRQLMEEIESRGGHLNAFTSRDHTCVYVKTLDLHVLNAIDVLADIIRNSQMNDFEKERNVILEEIATAEDVPEDFVHDLFCERLWPGHPLGLAITGSEETVAAMTVDDVRAYYAEHYAPENLLVSIVGNVNEDQVLDAVEAAFAPIPSRPAPAKPAIPAFGAGFEVIERPIAQHHLCFGFPGTTVTDDRRHAFDVLSSVLGGGSTSRLFEKVREEAGLAYSIYSFNYAYALSGTLGVYAAVAPESFEETLALTCAELRKVREEPIPESELAMNLEQLKAGLLMSLESTFNRMARMAKSYMNHGRLIPTEETVANLDKVTAPVLMDLARELFTPGQYTAVVLGPEGAKPRELPL